MLKLADDVRILTDLHNDVYAVNLPDWYWLYTKMTMRSLCVLPFVV